MLRICTCHLILEFGRKKIIAIPLYVSLYFLLVFTIIYSYALGMLTHCWIIGRRKMPITNLSSTRNGKAGCHEMTITNLDPITDRSSRGSETLALLEGLWQKIENLICFNLIFFSLNLLPLDGFETMTRFAFKLQNWTQLTTCKIPTTLNCSIYEDCPPAWWYRSQFSQIASFIRFCTKRLAKALKRKGCFALVHCRFRAAP